MVKYLAPTQKLGVRFSPRPLLLLNMKKKGKIVIVIIVVLLIGGLATMNFLKKGGTQASSGGGSGAPAKPIVFGVAGEEDYSNFENILVNNPMIQDLPGDSQLLLSFYNYYTGERTNERKYTITKGSVIQGKPSEYDIELILHSKYLTILESNNLCWVFQVAKSRGDFGSRTELSNLKLAWKFKSMMEYKDCLGL